MALPTECKQLLLQHKPTAFPDITLGSATSTFRLSSKQLPSTLPEGSVLLATRFLSNDPAQRVWISGTIDPDRLYTKPVDEGEPMRSGNIFEVVASTVSSLQNGTLVTVTDPGNNQLGWVSHAVVGADKCAALAALPNGLSPTHYLGGLGMTGLTAYHGMVEIMQAEPEDVVVVSGAAGATGSLAVQIAKKVVGCRRVVGIAGGAAKCQWVCSLGADVCVDYKSASFEQDIAAATDADNQPTVFFDNVGGSLLYLMLARMARYGRIAICGAISAYNSDKGSQPLFNWEEVISQRLTIKGIAVADAMPRAEELRLVLRKAVEDGRLTLGGESETVVETRFEDIPKTWVMLFSGGNVGKLVTKLIDN